MPKIKCSEILMNVARYTPDRLCGSENFILLIPIVTLVIEPNPFSVYYNTLSLPRETGSTQVKFETFPPNALFDFSLIRMLEMNNSGSGNENLNNENHFHMQSTNESSRAATPAT